MFLSCRNSGGSGEAQMPTLGEEAVQEEQNTNMQSYTSQKWHFSTEIPQGFKVFEGQLPGGSPVINIYDREIDQQPPFGIHNKATMAYMAVLPKGFGVDGPGGPRKSLNEWEGNLPLSFSINKNDSYAYLLESGEPWAISLSFNSAPPGWNEYGAIYIFYQVNDFRAECFSSNTGESIPIDQCDPMGGDAMKFYGKLSEEKMSALNGILERLYFNDPKREREEIENLIKVETPKRNASVSSPLQIEGRAKGYWFFEASAPVSLVTNSGKVLAEKYVEAQGDWMTEDWVPFSGQLEFETKEKRGHLIFSRANASGKPQHDRMLRVPVKFN
jgi:hypothetical protein